MFGKNKLRMKIEGMMCGHCEARVKQTLEAIEGVAKADVSHEKGTAVVNAAQTDTANPKTGDASDALPLMAMAESAFIAAIAMAIAKQRNKNEA